MFTLRVNKAAALPRTSVPDDVSFRARLLTPRNFGRSSACRREKLHTTPHPHLSLPFHPPQCSLAPPSEQPPSEHPSPNDSPMPPPQPPPRPTSPPAQSKRPTRTAWKSHALSASHRKASSPVTHLPTTIVTTPIHNEVETLTDPPG